MNKDQSRSISSSSDLPFPRVRIGISGWTYAPWRKVFYPIDLPQRLELPYASSRLSAIEINGTFYALQRPKSFQRWYQATPADFIFTIKGGRFITHMLKLLNVERALANFFASGVLELREKLGPILWQFPETFPFDLDRFIAFFEMLPRDHAAAAKIAQKHSSPPNGLEAPKIEMNRQLRHAVEMRNPAYKTEAFFRLLRKHDIAWVVADTAGHWPYAEDVTADFVYVRLHGDKELYASGYTPDALRKWAALVQTWSAGQLPQSNDRVLKTAPKKRKSRDVFVFFDNDIKVKAPADAQHLAELLSINWPASHPSIDPPGKRGSK